MQGGIEIPEGAYLNDYQTPGNYYCPSNDTASTLKNSPWNSRAFTLKVSLSTGLRYPAQICKEFITGKIAYRYLDTTASQNIWSDWSYFSNDNEIYKTLSSILGSLTQAYINKVNVTLQTGAASIEDSRIHPTSIVFAQAEYVPGNIGVITCCAQPMQGSVNVYIRSANNDALPEDGITVTVDLIVLNKP